MKLKQTFVLLLSALLVWGAPLAAENVNLLKNGSFEEHSCNIIGCSFEDWTTPLGQCTAEETDKIDGEISLSLDVKSNYTIDNPVPLSDDQYEAGTSFKIVMYYKVTAIADGSTVKSDCYWEAKAGATNVDEIKAHDAEVLTQVMADTIMPAWDSIVMVTTKPEKSSNLRIRVYIPKSTKILLDAFRVEQMPKEEPKEPVISVLPKTLSSVTANLGDTVQFAPIKISQANVTGATTFELTYTDADQFRLSQNSLAADQSECELIVSYIPTKAGTHKAVLNIDNTAHPSLFQSITLNASCVDTTAKPVITVTPSVVPTFETTVGKQISGKITVKSENCTDFIYLKVDHIQGQAFTIVESMLAKNFESEVTIYFTPLEEGTYQSTITISSQNATPVVVTLNGKANAKSEETIDWKTKFTWDLSQPKALLNEDFETSSHNETLILEGWQNVAPLDARPWWGYDENRATPPRGNNKCAKATAYQYGKSSTGIWEMWLVTPVLDYKNAQGKVFTFDVMAEYLPEEGSSTTFEVYYVDPTNPDSIFFQNLTGSFSIPATGDENEKWYTFHLNLTNQENIADAFCIAFRYAGPNGGDGAVTYFLDNISWGRTDLPTITPSVTSIVDSLAIVGQERVIGSFSVATSNLTEPVYMEIAGANYNRFKISSETVPAEGGVVAVAFKGEEEGVHQAYIRLYSKGAADVFIPMAVLCKAAQGIEDVQRNNLQCTKFIENGQLFIEKNGKLFNVLGRPVR